MESPKRKAETCGAEEEGDRGAGDYTIKNKPDAFAHFISPQYGDARMRRNASTEPATVLLKKCFEYSSVNQSPAPLSPLLDPPTRRRCVRERRSAGACARCCGESRRRSPSRDSGPRRLRSPLKRSLTQSHASDTSSPLCETPRAARIRWS